MHFTFHASCMRITSNSRLNEISIDFHAGKCKHSKIRRVYPPPVSVNTVTDYHSHKNESESFFLFTSYEKDRKKFPLENVDYICCKSGTSTLQSLFINSQHALGNKRYRLQICEYCLCNIYIFFMCLYAHLIDIFFRTNFRNNFTSQKDGFSCLCSNL